MQKVIFGIFAHPDDEAFGPSGYFLEQTKQGAELHLITLTLGQHGSNPDHIADLGAAREKEWHKGGRLMGATSQDALDFTDGRLCNIDMIHASETINQLVHDIIKDRAVSVEFVTSDLNGISGHIDHIVAARSASFVFYRNKANDERFSRIRYSVIASTILPAVNTDWLFMEPGRKSDEISQIVDTTRYHDEIVAIMRAHHSQRSDGEMHIKQRGKQLGMYTFIDRT